MRPRCYELCAHRPRIARPSVPQCSEASPKPDGGEGLSTARRGRSATSERCSSSSAHPAVRRHDDDESGFDFLMTQGLLCGKSPRLHHAVMRAPAHCAHRRCWVIDHSGSGLPVRREQEFRKPWAEVQAPRSCSDSSGERKWSNRIAHCRVCARPICNRLIYQDISAVRESFHG